jgi:N-glycosylase/DNA lyase
VRIRLPLPPGFSFDAVVRSHGWYDLPPFSYDAERGELTTGAGPAAWTFRVRDGRLEVSGQGGDAPSVRAMTRRVFSLDVELSAFDAALAGEPALRRALARGGGRMLRAPTLFEDAVKMLLTTNCSWAATRGMVQRLVALKEDGAFPGPEALARMSPGALRGKVRCGYRAGALSRFARRVTSGRLDLAGWERRETVRTQPRVFCASSAGTSTWRSTRGSGSNTGTSTRAPRRRPTARSPADTRATATSRAWRCGST